MKNSIRRKLLTFMCGLVAFVVVSSFLINSFFLERFYIYSQGQTLVRSMNSINQIYNSGSGDIELELIRIQASQGLQLIVFNSNLEIRYISWQDAVNLGFGRQRIIGGPDLRAFVNDQASPQYEISRNYDERLRMEYLDLVGALDDGSYVLLRKPVQTITDGVDVANRFLLLTGAFSLLVSIFISLRLSTWIAKPIRAVTDIA